MKVLAKFNEFKGGSNRGYLPHVYHDEQFLRWTVSLSLRALISEDFRHPDWGTVSPT